MTAPAPLPVSPRVFSTYLHLLAFCGGFNVMLLEMCGFRVLQSTFGASIYVTGVLLALVMIALSLGYWLGGRLSQRYGTLRFLLGVLVGVLLYVLVGNLLLGEVALEACFRLRDVLSQPMVQHVLPPALATVVLFGPPMLMLSMVSPYLIKLLASFPSARGVGSTAGNLMAVSNVGSIAGTLLPSFVLIPLLGVPVSLGVVLGSLGLMTVAGLVLERARAMAAVVAAGVVLGAWVGGRAVAGAWEADGHLGTPVFSGESLYGTVKVLKAKDDEGHTLLRFMPSREYVHSTVYPDRPFKDQFTNAYVNVGLARGAKHYLVLGMALGGAVSAILAADPEARVTAVEIDPLVVDLARQHVPRLDPARVRFVVEDARLFLREDTSTYDYIIADVFAGEQIPAHCMTQEFFALLFARLSADGVMMMNTNLWDFQLFSGLEDPAPFVPVRHLHATLFRVGFASLFQGDFFEHGHVYAFRQPTDLESVRRSLEALALNDAVAPALRASAAVASLTLQPVPAERKALRPFSDAWLPEHLLHLKDNLGGYLSALQAARARPEWTARVRTASAEDELRWTSVRHYAEVGRSFSPTGEGFRAYLKLHGPEYCREVFDWVARQERDPYPVLTRSVYTAVLKQCGTVSEEEGASSAWAVRTYARAAALVLEDQGEEALPLLTEVLEARR